MTINTFNVTNHDTGAPFWGIVDTTGAIKADGGRLAIFKTRKEARNRNRRVTGTVRKVYVSYEVRTEGGA